MCEGFFGTIKNEFFYVKDLKNTTSDNFIVELKKYLNWFKNKQIKKRIGYLFTKQFMFNYIQYYSKNIRIPNRIFISCSYQNIEVADYIDY